MNAPDENTLDVNSHPMFFDQLNGRTKVGSKVAMVALELQTRKRFRLNGVIADFYANRFSICVEQCFANCPQNIQQRQLAWRPDSHLKSLTEPVIMSQNICDRGSDIISAADTFFIASRSADLTHDPRTGLDASHRGGLPGFVRVEENHTVIFPDFSGNNFFNTLGNIHDDGRVGLFFPDFKTGDVVLISGRAEIDWAPDAVGKFKGAKRIIKVRVTRYLMAQSAWQIYGYSRKIWPPLIDTGVW